MFDFSTFFPLSAISVHCILSSSHQKTIVTHRQHLQSRGSMILCDFEANCSFKAESSEMWSIRKRKPTLQATGMEFDEELGLRFCRQDGHTVHDLNSTRRRTAGI